MISSREPDEHRAREIAASGLILHGLRGVASSRRNP
jgi:hypothetical protein